LDIRKISIGADYKSGGNALHCGQDVLGGKYCIHLIQYDQEDFSYRIWIRNKDEVLLWKEFKKTMPISLEYNINF